MTIDKDQYKRFENLSFDEFRRMATDDSLSQHEKIGFPDAYRAGKEELIFSDIVQKLPLLNEQSKTVVDIGPGCSGLPQLLIEKCADNGHSLILIDSEEMLSHLPNEPFIRKIPGYYPNCIDQISGLREGVDVCIAYSILHYVFAEGNIWEFLDRSLELLAAGGQMLIGDIPNISKRKRFFSSEAGIRFHQQFMNTTEVPQVDFNKIESGQIDDSVIFSLLLRAREAGFDACVVPQSDDLPMANRREDILIRRP